MSSCEIQMFKYQVLIYSDQETVKKELIETAKNTALASGIDLQFIDFIYCSDELTIKCPAVAIYICEKEPTNFENEYKRLSEDSIPIIPCVKDLRNVSSVIPHCLQHINAKQCDNSEQDLQTVVNLAFENLNLLRKSRRLFISYKRTDSSEIAMQLYYTFDEGGYDVFLDTRSVPPASDFQSVLWHRMLDSDIVILLDSPNFKDSKWTMEELTRANSSKIQILHLLWPEIQPDSKSLMSEFITLKPLDFDSGKNEFKYEKVKEIREKVESLRAKAIAIRHKNLVDAFCDLAKEKKAQPKLQIKRTITLSAGKDKQSIVVPIIGVPSASDIYLINNSFYGFEDGIQKRLFLLYDDHGILEEWKKQLIWLNEHLPIKSINIGNITNRIGEIISW